MERLSSNELLELKERCDKINIAWINAKQVKRLILTYEQSRELYDSKLYEASERNQCLSEKVKIYEKTIKLALETLENNNLMGEEYKQIQSMLDKI